MAVPRHIATYFDAAYAARGLVMLESLLRHAPHTLVTVLCFDDAVVPMIRGRFGDRVHCLPQASLEVEEPALVPLRTSRTRWEFYATHKAIFMRSIVRRSEPDEVVGYVDSDTAFYSDPEPLFVAMEGASIGITEHRFSEKARFHEPTAGRFNAGFGMWRNDAQGRQCLDDWADACLESCSAKPDGQGRYMNQGYLTVWPERYSRTKVLEHPGANLAPWNLGSHRVTLRGTKVLVDGQPLVFFHFSALRKLHDGTWRMHHWYAAEALNRRAVRRGIFYPYLAAVDAEREKLVREYTIPGLDLEHRVGEAVKSVDLGATASVAWPPPGRAHERLLWWFRD
jgi:hypothetical protein